MRVSKGPLYKQIMAEKLVNRSKSSKGKIGDLSISGEFIILLFK